MTTKKRKPSKKAGKPDLALPHFDRYFFVAAVIGVAALFAWVISPFFDTLVFAALVSVIFFPIQSFLMKKMKGWRTVPALITTMCVMAILLAPMIFLSVYLIQEAVEAAMVIQLKINQFDFSQVRGVADVPYLGEWMTRYDLNAVWNQFNGDILTALKDTAEAVSSFLVGSAGGFFKGLSDVTLQLFIFLITIFYFFKDGDQVLKYVKKVSPLPEKYENEIQTKLKESTQAVVVGNFGTAILQGLVGSIGFMIAGIDHILLWGTLMAFASLIPYVGAAIIWFPIALSLLFVGNFAWAGFLVLWGMLVVSMVDNVARPFLIGGQTKMHSLSTFLVVLGGVLVFGLKGIVYGPLILSLTLTLIHIYEMEYQDILKR